MKLMVSAVAFKAASTATASVAASSNAIALKAVDSASVEEAKASISAGQSTASNIVDPLVELRRRFVEHMERSAAYGAKSDPTDDDYIAADQEADAAEDLRKESIDLIALTPEGALAGLEWAREEFYGHYVQEPENPGWMDIWTLKMIDNMLGFARYMVTQRAA